MEIDAKAAIARYEKYINAMVDRFLSMKLPEGFCPDAGITFDRRHPYESPHWPIGTNLFTAEQAKAMFEECVPPVCYGLDDCSSQALSVCQWADKCGK